MQFFYIGIFGALGCVSRYLVSGWVYALAGRGLPYGTLAVNVLGSFLLGWLMEADKAGGMLGASEREAEDPHSADSGEEGA